ncbi:hypothetical protein niasHS_013340 [Heterodera schachtii]|uniref:Uncharacterized protein n=1 Tax=Heterodera schachtii TaxID=97005 RepID=A0ABD2IIN0_HETSC
MLCSVRRLLLPILFLLVLFFQKAIARRRKCPGTLSEDKIVREMFRNYTKKLPDSEHKDESVHVEIEMHVQDMGSLNEISADFEIDILFTQLWHDPSLSFVNLSSECVRNITMESRFLKDIWTPNTCIINAKRTSVHASPADNIMFILYENGTVWTNHRLSVKAPCALDLRTFPFDTQTCELLLESYSHNNEEVTLHWMAEPITMMKPIQLPDFDMVQFSTKRVAVLFPNGYWDELQVRFTFKRRYGFYILQAYVPTYLTIIVSWVGFCMEPKALPARTTVGVSSLLALTLQFGNIHKNLPRVSYVKAMDVWMLGCISFVFGTMIELAVVCYITRRQNINRSKLGGPRRSSSRGDSLSAFSQNLAHSNRRSFAFGDGPSPTGESNQQKLSCCSEATTLFRLMPTQKGGQPNTLRTHAVPFRNGTIPNSANGGGTVRRQMSNSSNCGMFPIARRRPKRRSDNFDERFQAEDEPLNRPVQNDGTPMEAEDGTANICIAVPSAQSSNQSPKKLLFPCQNGSVSKRISRSASSAQIDVGEERQKQSMDSRRSANAAGDESFPRLIPSPMPMPSVDRPPRPSLISKWRSIGDEEENRPIIQPESIDKFSIVVFPLTFTLFNLIYWCYYLSLGGQFDWQSNGTLMAQQNGHPIEH